MERKPDPWLIRAHLVLKQSETTEALSQTLAEIDGTDYSVEVENDLETNRLLILARSEEDLARAIDRLVEDGFRPQVQAPEIIYREALRTASERDQTYLPPSGREPSLARIRLAVAPGERFRLEDRTPPGSFATVFLEGVERGFRSVLDSGPCHGFPLLGLRVTLLEAEADESSTPLAFEVATRAGLRAALRDAGSVLMEPIMTLAVDAPESASGSVVSDLTSRRGNLSQIENLGLACRIRAAVPLSNLFGYINTLRSQTGGKGTFSQRFSHYAEVPFPPGDPDDFRPAVGMRG